MTSFSLSVDEISKAVAKFICLPSDDLPGPRGGPAWDFVQTAWMSVALLFIRVAVERIFIPILKTILGDKKKATAVFDDSFIAFFSALLEAHAIINTVLYNGGKFLSTMQMLHACKIHTMCCGARIAEVTILIAPRLHPLVNRRMHGWLAGA